MLSYALAIAVALSSLVLFLTAFLMSDIHRKDDFLWSGVGLFYASILWFCARNITGTVLLGQGAASILLVSFCWQTLKLRKAVANPEKASEISNFSILQAITGFLSRQKSQPPVTETPKVDPTLEKVQESEISIPEKPTEVTESKTSQSEIKTENPIAEVEEKSTTEIPKETIANPTKPTVDNPPQQTDDTIPAKQENETIPEKKSEESQETTVVEFKEDSKVVETPTENKIEVQNNEPEKQPSPLDSLETVEVAEILEADPDSISQEKSDDRNNIIEVTTTEIEINTDNKDSKET